jgi:hypothetical protein
MQAFKAANPGAVLEDFVRWYSPADWIEQPEGTGFWLRCIAWLWQAGLTRAWIAIGWGRRQGQGAYGSRERDVGQGEGRKG